MPQAFVTGATGFIGLNLVRELRENNWDVVAFHRHGSDISHLETMRASTAKGVLWEADSVAAAMPDHVDAVFHVAADTSPWRGHKHRQRRTNVDGTRAVVAAARRVQAGRLIYVSTIAVFGEQKGLITEDSEQKAIGSWINYARTKAEAEVIVHQAVREEGMDAVICNPTHIIGRYDRSNWARMFSMIKADALPGSPPGTGTFANGTEVARGLIKAFQRGRSGENYILGGPYASFKEVTDIIADLLGKPRKKVLPAAAIKAIAQAKRLQSWFTGREPDITPEAAAFICHDERASSDKAIDELGYVTVPLRTSLEQCFDWLKSEGHI